MGDLDELSIAGTWLSVGTESGLEARTDPYHDAVVVTLSRRDDSFPR